MKLTEISVNRAVTSIMISVALIILGLVSANKMPLDLYPDIEFPMAMILTEYEDVGPKEIESNVTRIIEESVSAINNVDEITAESREGMSIIRIQFIWGTDMSLAIADIREKLDMLKNYLPEGVEQPIVFKFDVSMMPIMILGIESQRSLSEMREYAEDDIKNLIEQVDGVASSQIWGGYENEIKIELNKNRMDAYNLSINTIVNILRMENMNVAGGDIKTPTREYTLRTLGEFTNLDQMRNIVVAVKPGAQATPVYLKDIAVVREAPEEAKDLQRLNGRNSVSMAIYKQSDKNTVLVAENVLKKIKQINPTLPPGMKITPLFNSADYIEKSVDSVTDNAILGGIIVVFVVFIFLRNFKASIILGLAIPISIIATFIAMYYFGFTLNMMSMGGLTLGVGMLIDNAIVVMDNIFRFRERGARPNEAAKLGSDEMAMAITASTLTTICVYLPFLFTEGLASQLFRQMALTISFSLLISLIIALTLIPTLTSKFVKNIHEDSYRNIKPINAVLKWAHEKFDRLEVSYGKIIRWALGHRKSVVIYTVIAILIGLVLLPVTGMEFIPETSENRIIFMAELPIGTNLYTTESMVEDIEKKLVTILDKSEYKAINVRAGSGEGLGGAFSGTKNNSARFEVYLKPQDQLKIRSVMEIKSAIRNGLTGFPGVTFNFNVQSGMTMGGPAISIEVFGYDLDQGTKFTKEISEAIKDVEGLVDIEISRKEGYPEKVIAVNRDKASKMGLNVMAVANILKNNVAGITATRYRKLGRELDVVVRLRDEDRQTVDDIMNISIDTPAGQSVPLGNIVDIQTRTGPLTIERKNQERVVYINCKAEGRPLNAVVADIQNRIDKLVKPTNFSVNITGAFEDMQETFVDLAMALTLALLLIYIIMASQFESLWSPFIIMFTAPTMVFGVMLFLFLTGTTFNVVSFMGVLMLSGIVVNNGIVLIDYTNILRARGYSLHDALIESGTKRLRPIMMTTFTTVFGLIPMAMATGEGSELSTPLGRSVLGGMASSFIFTLVFLPVVYSLLEQFRNKITGKKNRNAVVNS
ncbi:MAG: efflux RND transporter permease subunit [Spirochaetes bacterium]|nr:efflux RND transporter permease subunit [Spirochaetota bacterium]